MAEMNVPESGGKKGKKRSKKMSTRIDLTPMVDLGFLLITFFMLTTTFNKPQAMEVNMPLKPKADDPPPPEIKESKVLNLILSKDNKIYYYKKSQTDPKIVVDSTDYSKDGIRKVILTRQAEIIRDWQNKDELIILIKPRKSSKYKNLVDILDEMAITQTKKYAIVDFMENDSLIVAGRQAITVGGPQ